MIELTLAEAFAFYTAVFLALVVGSWFLFARRRSRWETMARRIFICGVCQAEIPDQDSKLRLRCPACGAVQHRHLLAQKASAGFPKSLNETN